MAATNEPGATVSTPTVEIPPDAPERKGFYVNRWVLVAIGVVLFVAAAVAIGFAVTDRDDGDRREFGGFGQHHGGRPVLALIVLLVLIGLVIAAAVLIARRYREHSTDVRTNAERILAERFARGEIDEADYLGRRNALRS